jgi:hypothetical protein
MEALRGSDCFYLMDPLNVAEGGLVNDYGIFCRFIWAIIGLP